MHFGSRQREEWVEGGVSGGRSGWREEWVKGGVSGRSGWEEWVEGGVSGGRIIYPPPPNFYLANIIHFIKLLIYQLLKRPSSIWSEPKLKQTKLIGFLIARPSKNPAAIADPHDHHPGPHLQHHETAVPNAIMRDDDSSTCAARFLQSDVCSEDGERTKTDGGN